MKPHFECAAVDASAVQNLISQLVARGGTKDPGYEVAYYRSVVAYIEDIIRRCEDMYFIFKW